MVRVALVHQPYRRETGEAARDTGVWLGSRGDECELLSAFDLERHDPSEFDLAVSFGGDGTTLRTARWAVSGGEGTATAAVPIVPIGMGKLSFLAELTPSQVRDQLDSYLGGDFWRDETSTARLLSRSAAARISEALAVPLFTRTTRRA